MSPIGAESEAVTIARRLLALPAERRRGAAAELCGADAALLADVERLLEGQGEQTIASGASAGGAVTVAAGGVSGRRVGAFTVVSLLGEGGMGEVYLAQQERPRRMVALKLVRAGLATPRMLRRFEHESELLARLQHPGIAQVYEAGTVTDGGVARPYFAMEYVEGARLGDWARRARPSVRARLELLARVCDAVHHAHQKGVIHRDLKPGNILVIAGEGGSAVPKVLDFGVARSTDADLETRTFETEVGQLVGTVPYMSPEQLSGDPRAIDTRSDVYALGVVMYELLAGRLPHALSDKTLPEALRTVSEEAPARLGGIDRTLRGDLETIAGRALEKDRERRYQSASDMAADLRRSLRDEPILARPPSRAYLFRKFASRNRAVVTGSAVAVLALVGGIVGTSVQAVRAERARAAAREDAAFALAANEFLTGMLAAANPDRNNERELTVREMLDRAAERLERGEEGSRTPPRVAMSLHNTLSSTYRSLGRPDVAVAQAERAVSLATGLYGAGHKETIDTRRTLAMALTEAGRLEDAERVTRECLAAVEALPGAGPVEAARVRAELGRVLLEAGEFVEAESLLRAAVEVLVPALGEEDDAALIAIDHMGLALQRLGRFEEAERFERRGLEIRERVFGKDSTVTAFSLNNLANISQRLGRNEEALALLQRALEIRRAKLDAEHPSLLVSMSNLAVALVGLKRTAEAESLLRETAALQARRLGDGHPKTLSTLGNLAYVLEELGRLDEAEATLRRVVDARRAAGWSAQESWGEMNNLAMLLQKRGDAAAAEAIYRELIPVCESRLPTDHYLTAIFRGNLGSVLTDLKRYEDAERELLRAQPVIEGFFKAGHARTAKGRERLATLYEAWGKPDKASAYR